MIIDKENIGIWEYASLNDIFVEIHNVKYIGKHAFADSNNLKMVIIFGDGAFIDEGCFSYCNSLEIVEMHGVNVIEKAAFSWCTSLKELVIDVDYIGEGCFFHCNGLKKVVFSERLKALGDRAFLACFELEKVGFLGTCHIIGENCFSETKVK